MTGTAIPAKPDPLEPQPLLDWAMGEIYGGLRACPGGTTVALTWMILRSTLKAARTADGAPEADLIQALAAALGEIIADLPPERQALTVQTAIHQAFAYAEQLRAPGFDQPHGATGHA